MQKYLIEMNSPLTYTHKSEHGGYSAACLAEGLSEGSIAYLKLLMMNKRTLLAVPKLEKIPILDKNSLFMGRYTPWACSHLGVTFDLSS